MSSLTCLIKGKQTISVFSATASLILFLKKFPTSLEVSFCLNFSIMEDKSTERNTSNNRRDDVSLSDQSLSAVLFISK